MSVYEIIRLVEMMGGSFHLKEGRLFLSETRTPVGENTLGKIKQSKAEIIAFLQSKARIVSDFPALEHNPEVEKVSPLAYSQERLWFLEQLGLVGTAYNISDSVRIEGPLDLNALQRSFNLLVERHPALRTHFETAGDDAIQVIDEPYEVAIEIVDLQSVDNKQEEVARLAREEAIRPFNLHKGRLLRVHLLKLSQLEHVMLLTIHHIVSDGWSIIVVIREINSLYTSFSQNKLPSLAPLKVNFNDYIHWQRSWLTPDVIESELSYWRYQLEGAPPVLEVPADFTRPAVQSFEGATVPFELGKTLSEQINQLSKQESVTPFMVLLAAFKVLLYRWTGQKDMVVGTGIAGRNHHEVEDLIGFFVNTLVMRTHVGGAQSFKQLLQQVRDVALGAYAHQHIPFEKLVAELRPERDLSRQPLVQVHIVLLNMPQEKLELPRLTLTRIGSEMCTSKFDLSLFIREDHDGFHCEFEFATDLFHRSTVERFAQGLILLLEGVVETPELSITQLPLLTSKEKQHQLKDWNTSREEAVPNEHVSVLNRIAQLASANPQAQALKKGQQTLSYWELEAQSNKLARRLIEAGAGEEQIIAVCLTPSIDFILSILAVMKTGAAYLPLDPEYPSARLSQMLTTAEVEILVSKTDHLAKFADFSSTQINLDVDEYNGYSESELKTIWHPLSLAYVIFTSGSTGQPKGVQISHASLHNLAIQQAKAFSIQADSNVLQFASLSFDASVSEIFTTLVSGACLCFLEEDRFQSVERLAYTIEINQVDVLTLPPSLLALLSEQALPSVKTLVVAGEPCPTELARLWSSRCRLINAYGPTESTVCGTWAEYAGQDVPPIGRALANLSVYVLNDDLEIMPLGAVGELFLGGSGLARGYINQAGLTAEAFVPSPFGEGERLYRTGDSVRFRPDGNLEFVGRMDEQHKIRGYRIELGEISSRINGFDGVIQSHVDVWQDVENEKKLVGYVCFSKLGSATGENNQELQDGLVDMWRQLFDDAGDVIIEQDSEQSQPDEQDYSPSFSGWNSSYTGAPIPTHEMEMWLAATVAHLRRFNAPNVLEIGCGSGLIIQHLIDHCEHYVGTDISTKTLQKLSAWVAQQGNLEHLELVAKSSLEFDVCPPQSRELIILNSVIQYFPNVNYLIETLKGATELLQQGGQIFIGDVRHLGLSRLFQTSLLLDRAATNTTLKEFHQLLDKGLEDEKELLVDPAFFYSLPKLIDKIKHVEVHLKPQDCANELFSYRYDVILYTTEAQTLVPDRQLSWSQSSLSQLRNELSTYAQDCLFIEGIANDRFSMAKSTLESLDMHPSSTSLHVLLDACSKESDHSASPHSFIALAHEFGYEARFWLNQAHPTQFDLLLMKAGMLAPSQAVSIAAVSELELQNIQLDVFKQFTNNPLKHTWQQQQLEKLKLYLHSSLPEFMVPNFLIGVEQFALTENGKIDKTALPKPNESVLHAEYVLASTETQQTMVALWQELLQLNRIGIRDTFFDLGGHSLLATRLVMQIQDIFAVELSIRELFEYSQLQELCAYIDMKRQEEDKRSLELTPIPRTQDLALSYAQERLWFLEQLEVTGVAYNISDAVRLKGKLNTKALENSFQLLIERHEVLRARIIEKNGIPRQVFTPQPMFQLQQLQNKEFTDPSKLEALLRKEMSKPFELTRGELLRALLIPLSETENVLVISMHHIISDGWSMSILVSELGELYHGLTTGTQAQLADLAVQYADYADWQRKWLKQDLLQKELAYWKAQLKGAPAALSLPLDKPRPAVQGYQGAILSLDLGAELSALIRELSKQEDVTLFMVFLAVFQIQLSRWSGQQDVVVGTPIAGRTHGKLESLIGFFVNTLVMRGNIDSHIRFTDLLASTKETALQAYANQNLPFDKLVAELKPKRDLSRQPIFQNQLIFLNIPELRLNLHDLELIPIASDVSTAKYDLTLYVSENERGFKCQFEYAVDLFEASTIERFSLQFKQLMAVLVGNPEKHLREIELLTADEKHQVVDKWNQTSADFNLEANVLQLISNAAQANPNKVALICQDQSITYQALLQSSNQLAHYLCDQGVKPGDLIGICLERGPQLVLGLLAIMKAGAAYVPLDPDYPQDRLSYMLEDSGSQLLLTHSSLAGLFADKHCLLVDDLQTKISSYPLTAPQIESLAKELAYVIYTSGSTGLPKGVMVERGALANFMCAMAEQPGLETHDTLVAVTPVSFDISCLELYLPLIRGATLVLADRETAMAGDALLTLLEEQQATMMQATPATWRMLLEAGWTPDSQFTALCGGEALPFTLMKQLAERCVAWNLYGPTETTIWSTRWPLSSSAQRVSIGEAIENTCVYVVDEHFNPQPVGVAGELLIGGEGLARGYLQRPGLTAERFIPSPFFPGQRLYRTGDLVRLETNGQLQYLSRMDNQVKIRGHRIELGEIETALLKVPGVKQAAVVDKAMPGRTSEENEKRLVAYLAKYSDNSVIGSEGDALDRQTNGMQFSLHYFADAEQSGAPEDMYELYLSGAKRADELGLTAVWTPERHFTDVAAAFPNPATLSAALSTITSNIQLRSGSVVAPLHNPLRIAEEWAVVDRLSGGRAGLSFATGWFANDFVLAPDAFENKRELMFEHIDTVQKLWRGQAIDMTNGEGQKVSVKALPTPIQAEIPVWITAAGNPATFRETGEKGYNILTGMFGQNLKQLAENIAVYRQARSEAGLEPYGGTVTVMLHTFIADSQEQAAEYARQPLSQYFRSHVALREQILRSSNLNVSVDAKDVDAVIKVSVERFLTESALIGSPTFCLEMSRKLKGIGVDEISCLIDFGVAPKIVVEKLDNIAWVMNQLRNDIDLDRVRKAVDQNLPAYMHPTEYVLLNEFPRTPNGKLDRKALPEPSWGQSDAVYVEAGNEVQRQLTKIWNNVLGIEHIGIRDNFFALGGDSIQSIQVVAKAREFGLYFSARQMYENQTIEQLSGVAAQKVQYAQDNASGECPLLPIQHWFFEQNMVEVHHFNLSLMLLCKKQLDGDKLEQVLQQLWQHHDALRLGYQRHNKHWQQSFAELEPALSLERVDLSACDEHNFNTEIQRVANELQAGLTLAPGGLIRVALIDCPEPEPQRLLFATHHLLVDGVSWRILVEDLQRLYEQQSALPLKTLSYKAWGDHLTRLLVEGFFAPDLAYWQAIENEQVAALPVDQADGVNKVSRTRLSKHKLDSDLTASLLGDVHQTYHTGINDLLLAALTKTLADWSCTDKVKIYIEGHGREELTGDCDVSRTVGWFTALFPVLLELCPDAQSGDSPNWGELLISVKEQLRLIPHKGLSYGVLRYLDNKPLTPSAQTPEISFNYLGQLDVSMGESSLFSLTEENFGQMRSLKQTREHLIDLSAAIIGGQLEVYWRYCEDLHFADTIEDLHAGFFTNLKSLISYCQNAEMRYTRSDFPMLEWSQDAIDEVAEMFGGHGNIEAMYPLTPVQQGIFFDSMRGGYGQTYFVTTTCQLSGELEVDRFAEAWQKVIERHTALRTAVVNHVEPIQVVLRQVKLEFDYHDWSTEEKGQLEQKLSGLQHQDRDRGFDLRAAPLMRVHLVKCDNDSYHMIWGSHFIALDGWSSAQVLGEVLEAFRRRNQSTELFINKGPSYAEYVSWQRKQDKQRAATFWRETLEDFQSVPTLWIRNGKTVETTGLDKMVEQQQTLTLSTGVLDAFCKQQKIPPGTVFQAVWALLVSQYNEQQDVVIGVASSGRQADLPALDSMVGLFVNTLPYRIRIDNQITVCEFLKKVQQVQIDAQEFQYCSLAEIKDWAGIDAQAQLFDNVMVYQNYPIREVIDSAGKQSLEISHIQGVERNNFPLTLMISQESDICLKWIFDSSIYDEQAMNTVSGYFDKLLLDCVQNAENPMYSLTLTSAALPETVPIHWVQGPTKDREPQVESFVHRQFAAQAKQAEDQLALKDGGTELAYADVEARVNQLAHLLLDSGVQVGDPVGICMPLGTDLICSMLAVLRVGGCYVPIDNKLPTDRVNYILGDCKAKAVLSSVATCSMHRLDSLSGVVCLQLDSEPLIKQLNSLKGNELHEVNLGSAQQRTAYIIYTSGTSGRPKGVKISHSAMSNYVNYAAETYLVKESKRKFASYVFMPVSFDASITAIFAPLIAGRGILIGDTALEDGFADLEQGQSLGGFDFIKLTPGQLAVLKAKELDLGFVDNLVLGGEQLNSKSLPQGSSPTIFNEYGPTETTVGSTVFKVESGQNEHAIVPIGFPITNVQNHVVRETESGDFVHVPTGMIGELLIGGQGVAQGYINQLELEQLKFISCTFGEWTPSTYYRTGDRVRRLENGALEFIGRVDDQVKLRGHRVELGEIEACLLQLAYIKQAHVKVHGESEAEKMLVAYVVADQQIDAEEETLIDLTLSSLAEKLPPYMLPSKVFLVAEFPLDKHGKLDKKALPEPYEQACSQLDDVAQTETEAALLEMWSELFKRDPKSISLTTGFLELGGNSLLILRLLGMLKSRLGLDVDMDVFFKRNSIRVLAETIDAMKKKSELSQKIASLDESESEEVEF